MPTPLASRRFSLAPVDTGDIDRVTALLRMPDVRRFLCDDALLPREDVVALVGCSRDPADVTSWWRIAADGRDCIGIAGLQPLGAATARLRAIGWRSLELMIALDPAWWGRGLAAEVIEAVAGYALADGVTFAIVGAVDEPNLRSHRLLRRCGFTEVDRVAGPKHRLVVYERTL